MIFRQQIETDANKKVSAIKTIIYGGFSTSLKFSIFNTKAVLPF